MWQWIWNNKTKLTGYAMVGLGAIQTGLAMYQPVLTPREYAGVSMAIGVLVALIGHANSNKP